MRFTCALLLPLLVVSVTGRTSKAAFRVCRRIEALAALQWPLPGWCGSFTFFWRTRRRSLVTALQINESPYGLGFPICIATCVNKGFLKHRGKAFRKRIASVVCQTAPVRVHPDFHCRTFAG